MSGTIRGTATTLLLSTISLTTVKSDKGQVSTQVSLNFLPQYIAARSHGQHTCKLSNEHAHTYNLYKASPNFATTIWIFWINVNELVLVHKQQLLRERVAAISQIDLIKTIQ
jgi:hypothetical protein